MTHALAVLAASGDLNATGVIEWIAKNVLPLLLLFIGIAIIATARKGRIADNATIVLNVVIGMALMGGAAVLYAFSGRLVGLVFGSG